MILIRRGRNDYLWTESTSLKFGRALTLLRRPDEGLLRRPRCDRAGAVSEIESAIKSGSTLCDVLHPIGYPGCIKLHHFNQDVRATDYASLG